MNFNIEKDKIKNRIYNEKMIVYSGDLDNQIVLPDYDDYIVMYKNKNGALPIVDYFTGTNYKLNLAVYYYLGDNVIEFMKIKNTKETVLLVNLLVNASIDSMQNKKLGGVYVKDLEEQITLMKKRFKEIDEEVEEMYQKLSKISFEIKNNDLYVEKTGGMLNGFTKFR